MEQEKPKNNGAQYNKMYIFSMAFFVALGGLIYGIFLVY